MLLHVICTVIAILSRVIRLRYETNKRRIPNHSKHTWWWWLLLLLYLASTQSTIYVDVRANCLLHFFFFSLKLGKSGWNKQDMHVFVCVRISFTIRSLCGNVLAVNFHCVCVRWSCFYLFGKCTVFMHFSRLFQLDGYTLTKNSQFYFLSYQILLLLLIGCRSSTQKKKKTTRNIFRINWENTCKWSVHLKLHKSKFKCVFWLNFTNKKWSISKSLVWIMKCLL